MKSIEIKSRAKINLSIDVIKKRPDGYHDVKMIMQSISLHDNILIKIKNGSVDVQCNNSFVPSDNRNIAFKAAKMFIDRYNIKDGVSIFIDKKIPVAAGLGGGSTNAAAVLTGMNQMFSMGIDEEELMSLGRQIGADVPFCIKGGTMLAEGIGEILTDIKQLEGFNIVLIKPDIGVSTKWVYSNLKLDRINNRPETEKLIGYIEKNNIYELSKNMKNVLETVTIPQYSIVRKAKEKLIEFGALGSLMSGSGPTVFGIFSSRATAEAAYLKAKSENWLCFLCETANE